MALWKSLLQHWFSDEDKDEGEDDDTDDEQTHITVFMEF